MDVIIASSCCPFILYRFQMIAVLGPLFLPLHLTLWVFCLGSLAFQPFIWTSHPFLLSFNFSVTVLALFSLCPILLPLSLFALLSPCTFFDVSPPHKIIFFSQSLPLLPSCFPSQGARKPHHISKTFLSPHHKAFFYPCHFSPLYYCHSSFHGHHPSVLL